MKKLKNVRNQNKLKQYKIQTKDMKRNLNARYVVENFTSYQIKKGMKKLTKLNNQNQIE